MTDAAKPLLRVTSYNVLADAYATGRRYPDVPASILRWERRAPALVDRLRILAPDIACLQEVQAEHWPDLERRCAQAGWRAVFAQKQAGRVDGCALLFKTASVRLAGSSTLYFADGVDAGPVSGHLALIGRFDTVLGPLTVATTHLRWQGMCASAQAHIGFRQAQELIAYCKQPPMDSAPAIICGDFNVTPDHVLVQRLLSSGFRDVYADEPQPTCVPNGRIARIDFIFASASLTATCERLPELTDTRVLPNAHEPSDHLPITAHLSISAGTSA